MPVPRQEVDALQDSNGEVPGASERPGPLGGGTQPGPSWVLRTEQTRGRALPILPSLSLSCLHMAYRALTLPLAVQAIEDVVL